MKKTISVLLCICIAFCMSGTTAFALGGESGNAGTAVIEGIRVEGFTVPEVGKTPSTANDLKVTCTGADNAKVDITLTVYELDKDGNQTFDPKTFKEGCVYNFSFKFDVSSEDCALDENAKLEVNGEEYRLDIYLDGKLALSEGSFYCTAGDLGVKDLADYGVIFFKAYVKKTMAFISDLFAYVSGYKFFPNGFEISEIANLHSRFFLFLADVLSFIAEYRGGPVDSDLLGGFLAIRES